MSKYLVLLLLFATALANNEESFLGTSQANPATSCHDIYQHNPTSRGSVGQYWIKTSEGLFEVTCNMKLKCDGVEGGWMQVVDVDMNRDDSCPGTWHKITTPRKLCIGKLVGPSCASTQFYVKGVDYQHICGQTKAYQKGSPDAFVSRKQSIDDAYVDGISITLGSPRKHVWTYAAGLSDDHDNDCCNCPCATHPGPPPPAFVGNHYYCESGNVGTWDGASYHLSDPLWDGTGCGTGNGCCAQIGMPWFYRKLPVCVTDDFEVRICIDQSYSDEDVAIEKLELYIK
ncbi:uncharacterized protein [Dysidea avara]|uniref:uncharacterized protein n=1 Tax=Dysidea avara TaxID=196820 RepID=UPI00332D0F95